VLRDEPLHRGAAAQALRRRHRGDQDEEANRQPEQVEPPAAADAHPGSDPVPCGTDPAQVVGSTTSSPFVSCARKLCTACGETPEGAGAGRSVGVGSSAPSAIRGGDQSGAAPND